MLKDFEHLVQAAKQRGMVCVSVAVAQDEEVLLAVKQIYEAGIARAILVGDKKMIGGILGKIGLASDAVEIIDEKDVDEAALVAAEFVAKGKADILVKGFINSSNFLRAALDKERGLRTGNLLSHLACFEIPGEEKLVFHTDGGMNIAPSFAEKKEILINSLQALEKMGIKKPKVAVLSANEKINEKMPVTLDARDLVLLGEKGELPPCQIEGPIAMDVAVRAEAALHKGINSQIAGSVDLFLVPSIEAGNMVGKTLVCYAKAKMAGLILGAKKPIVLVSRSDTAEAKVNSIVLARLALEE